MPTLADLAATMNATRRPAIGNTGIVPPASRPGVALPTQGSMDAWQAGGGTRESSGGMLDMLGGSQAASGAWGGFAPQQGGPGGSGRPRGPGANHGAHDAMRALRSSNPAAYGAQRDARVNSLMATPGFKPSVQESNQGVGMSANQWVDDTGRVQYGYGQDDPRNNGAPLYDDPRNGIKGTLGPKPGFDYSQANMAYWGNG